MEIKNWSKSLLSMYRYLEPLTHAIDRIVESKSSTSYYSRTMDTLNDFEDIIRLTEKKILYINIKLFIDQIILSMDKDYSKLLILKYFENYRTEGLCETLGVIPRTMFRRHNAAIRDFSKKLAVEFDRNPDMFNDMMSDSWIKSIYDYFCLKSSNVMMYQKPKEGTKDVFKILNTVIMNAQNI